MEITETTQKNKLFTHPLFITLIALLCCALWGSATPFIKVGYEVLLPEKNVPSTILFAGIRFTLAGILTIIIFSIARKRLLYPKKENLHRVAIVGCVQTIIQYIFFYVGLANTTGVKGTILSGSSTFFAIIVSSLIFRLEKLTLKKMIACIFGFAGIIIVNLNGLTFDMNFTGDCFVLFSAMSLAVSSVLIKRYSKYEDPVVISGYQFILGGAVMIAVGLAFGGQINLATLKGIGILVYLAFLSAIAYSLWGILLKHNPVSKVTIFSFTTPIFGVLLSAVMLSESGNVPIINLLATLVLISTGILILNYQKTQKN
ncbi:MAG: DMT family transporter [Ruminococcaceae bacterium]|nr:DMT family transporter [Oscillospiraceae bacterium]MBQ9692738.1 DMT family transporter [Clostridia bacterium]